ncbi:hypothetical protein [Gallaecimonas mangrovi]|uniref:hypothetical protein n=1 Tax=Gallaecimonas mangrovi TaxID=2291597 RepID=UPI000E2001C5|nr:hypothetical protein [Gallaecimonas mangrovi]
MSSELKTVIDALKAEGRKPTLALVKARLTSPLPLPVIIKALQGEPVEPVIEPPAPFTEAQKIWLQHYVEAQLAPFKAALKKHGIVLDETQACI